MPTRSYLKNRRACLVFIISAVTAFTLFFSRTGRTHEPITTTVMFNKEVIRIFQQNCLGCHSAGRIKADIPLTTYEEARPWAKAIKEEILEKRMMPYQSVKGFGDFQHDYILPKRDVDLLVSWIEGGAPRGEEKDYPKQAITQFLRGDTWVLGQPDLVLQPASETKVTAEGEDEVRCFVLPTRLSEDRWISAFDFQPGNGAIVYSASFYIGYTERNSQARRIKPSNRNGDACGTKYEETNHENLGQWVPGQGVNRLPAGIARLLPANSRVLMKIRYRKNGEATTDRSRIALYFAKDQINKTVRNVTINSREAAIPAKDERHRVRATYTITEPTEVVAIRPILFPHAETVESTAYRPDGTIEVLIWARKYRFDWQPVYYFRNPIALPKGTRIEITAYLNKSESTAVNPNDRPNDRDATSKFADALCEITLTSAASQKPGLLKQASR